MKKCCDEAPDPKITTATTIWQYSPTRGFLLAKRDAANKGANYTYTAAGRLATRTWARGITTTYSYDNGGRMVSTNYSDSTPDITMAYDALGRQTSQSNGLATTTYAYDSATLRLNTETVSYDLNNDNTPDFTRVIDRSQDTLGRDTGWQLKDGATVENEAAYSYSATDGRISSISNPQLSNVSFGYTYEPNSYGLIKTVTGSAHTVTNTWEANRDVLSLKENKVGTTNISSYGYGVNSIGQRTDVAKTGSAFAGVRDITWGYNAKGEVVKADSTIPGLDRAYLFDGIGNRLKSADSLTLPATNNYTPNALNQYTAIDALNPVHDDDGNMTSGPLPANVNANSVLVWDGENRLIQAQVNSGSTVSYLYDSQSRRIAETVGANTTVYVHDGWNPICEYSISNNQYSISKAFTWGIDLSGSLQGAGGVGGLLAVSDVTGTYYPTFDGNGNVSEYLNLAGVVQAHYEYDPFGRTTVATGPKANDFAHRFSTKPLDTTTGLYYYGYRFYDPNTGRWPSRDPIAERGGVNLYGFADNNDGLNSIDLYGLTPTGTAAADAARSLMAAGNLLNTVPTGHSSGMYNAWLTLWTEFLTNSKEVNYGGFNGYNRISKNITITTNDQPVVLHELVHQYTNPNLIGSESERVDEGRAYTFEYMHRTLQRISGIVKHLSTSDPKKSGIHEVIAFQWDAAWDFGRHDMQGELNVGGYFDITGADFGNTRSTFRAQIRCYEIADELKKLADSKGYCIRFSCDHTETAGWEITGNRNKMKLQYVAPPKKELHGSLK